MAAACAEFIHADRLIFLTDVAGVLDGDKVLKVVSTETVEELIRRHKVSGGMVLKLEACKRALAGGVRQVRIVGGNLPRGLLSAANGGKGPGTRVTPMFPAAASAASGGRQKAEAKVSAKNEGHAGHTSAVSRNGFQMKKATKEKVTATRGARALRDDGRYLMNTYKRPPVVFSHGKGCYLYGHRGPKYLDFLGGIAVNALGHAHPRLVRVIRREAARAIHVSNLFHNPYQGPLARRLAQWSGMDRVFFTNSGTEAIEGALKLARLYARQKSGESSSSSAAASAHSAAGTFAEAPGGTRTRILALENSFHGRTFGALSITATAKYREPFAPLVPGVEFVRFNDLEDLDAKFDSSVCAMVIEPIQGEGGIYRSEEHTSELQSPCNL